MKISGEQMRAFEEVRLPDFEDRMVEHLREFTPLHTKSLGEEGIRKLIQAGMARAKRHGFTRRGSVRFYIETTVLLGIDFDTDPQYPRIGEILADKSMRDETDRADAIHEWLALFLNEVGGPDREFAKRSLKRGRRIPLVPISQESPTFMTELISRMRDNYPEKVEFLGERAMKGLIKRAVEEATRQSVATDAGVCMLLGLMYSVGHGVTNDPKYPWVAGTLTGPSLTADRRVERLHSKTMTYLDHVLEHLEAQ